MTPDGFLTLLGLMVAAYAAMPTVFRIRLEANRSAQLIVLLVLGLPSLLLLLLRPKIDFMPNLDYEHAAFFFALAWFFTAGFVLVKSKPTATNLKTIRRLSRSLILERNYSDLARFLAGYIPIIAAANERRLPLQVARHSLINYSKSAEQHDEFFDSKRAIVLFVPFRALAALVAHLLPSRNAATEEAQKILLEVFTDDQFLIFVGQNDPEFCALLISNPSWTYRETIGELLIQLASSEKSQLFKELKLTFWSDSQRQNSIPTSCQVLQSLLYPVRNAERHSAWKPIGDQALFLIEHDHQTLSNLARPGMDESDVFSAAPYLLLHFIKLCALRGIEQNAGYHMWVMYMSVAIRSLCNNISIKEDVDLSDEFPTLAHRLIYEILSMLRDVIEYAAEREPSDGVEQRALILYWASKDYCKALKHILQSNELSLSFKRDRLESFVSMREANSQNKLLVKILTEEILSSSSTNSDTNYRRILRDTFNSMDFSRQADAADIEQTLDDSET
jgi:hypothetical protein